MRVNVKARDSIKILRVPARAPKAWADSFDGFMSFSKSPEGLLANNFDEFMSSSKSPKGLAFFFFGKWLALTCDCLEISSNL